MRVDEFRKTLVTMFPGSELEEYQHAVDVQEDPLLKIWSEAWGADDIFLDDHYSVHYTGTGFLDDFWNTVLKLKPVEKKEKKDVVKKKRQPIKKVAKKKVAAKKTPVKHTGTRKAKKTTLVEF